MAWLEKLKGLFSINVNSPLISVSITKNSNNQINSESNHYYDKDKAKLEIYIDNISETKKEALAPILQEFIDQGNKLLERETSELLRNLYRYNKENENKQILNFFKQIISSDDFEALDSSLYLREIFRKREDIKKLKSDIKQRFGDRGNNIANLCTAGYFEEFLMPLYNSSKEERFKELYEIIVSKSVVAVFVNSNMEQQEITSEITKKLEISKRYGIKFIHIHGIRETNVVKIKKCIEEKKDFFGFFEKEIYEKDNIIIIELLLR